MRKPSFSFLILIALIASIAQADTIHLKNGSLLKGKVTNYADDQFIVMLDTGSGRYVSKAMVFIGDVARIEFDSASGGSVGASDSGPSREATASAKPDETAEKISTPKESARDTTPAEESRAASQTEAPAKVVPTVDPPRESTSSEPKSSAVQPRDPDPQPEKVVEKPSVIASSLNPPASDPSRETGTPETSAASSKESSVSPNLAPERVEPTSTKSADHERNVPGQRTQLRTVTTEVQGRRKVGGDWVSSQMLIEVGDRVRINATGKVVLDETGAKSTGPEGLTLPDSDKLMADQPTGGLIGVIGSDNDIYFFVGKSLEFTARNRGLLFLAVNEGNLADNSGSYTVTVQVQRATPK